MAPAICLASWKALTLDPTMLRSSGAKGRVLAETCALLPLNALIGDEPGIAGSDEGAGVGRSCIILADYDRGCRVTEAATVSWLSDLPVVV